MKELNGKTLYVVFLIFVGFGISLLFGFALAYYFNLQIFEHFHIYNPISLNVMEVITFLCIVPFVISFLVFRSVNRLFKISKSGEISIREIDFLKLCLYSRKYKISIRPVLNAYLLDCMTHLPFMTPSGSTYSATTWFIKEADRNLLCSNFGFTIEPAKAPCFLLDFIDFVLPFLVNGTHAEKLSEKEFFKISFNSENINRLIKEHAFADSIQAKYYKRNY